MKEYIAYLDGEKIDSKGFKTSHGITANTKAEAIKLLSKAKMYYCGRYRNCDVRITVKNT